MNGAGSEGLGTEALAQIRRAAGEGDAAAQLRLGRALLRGEGVIRDARQACAWLLRAAESGNGDAQAEMGFLCEKGLGVEADLQQALAWYERAVAQDNPLGHLRMGDLFLRGLGVDQSHRKAIARYLQAAEQRRDPPCAALARMRLGDLHSQGRGVEKNLRQAFAFYLQAARMGNADAQRRVGILYRDGVGVARDPRKAQSWLQKSTGRSGVPADSALGDLYRDGRVVARDLSEAMKFYERAAAKGDDYAKRELLKLRQEQGGTAVPPVSAPPAGGGKAAGGNRGGRRPAPDGGGVRPAAPTATSPAQKQEPPARTREARGRERPAVGKRSGKRRFPSPLWPAAGLFLVLVLAFAARLLREPAGDRSVIPAIVLPRGRPSAPLPPALPGVPDEALLPPAKDRMARPPDQRPPVLKEPVAAAVAVPEPSLPALRSVAAILGEKELAEALAAKGLFDAVRNPAGKRRQSFALRATAGLAMVVDCDARLVWTQRQNPLPMNLRRARQWIASLNRARYGGIDTWRLPTAEEAAALLRPAAGDSRRFLAEPFDPGGATIWTDDRVGEAESWVVDFHSGSLRPAKFRSRLAVLMVSSDHPPCP